MKTGEYWETVLVAQVVSWVLAFVALQGTPFAFTGAFAMSGAVGIVFIVITIVLEKEKEPAGMVGASSASVTLAVLCGLHSYVAGMVAFIVLAFITMLAAETLAMIRTRPQKRESFE